MMFRIAKFIVPERNCTYFGKFIQDENLRTCYCFMVVLFQTIAL